MKLQWKPPRHQGLAAAKGTARVSLVTGVNEVSEEAFRAVADHDLTRHYLKTGDLVILEEEAEKAPPATLEDLKGPEAIELVEATADPDLLEAWEKAETRKTVRAAIEARLTEILG